MTLQSSQTAPRHSSKHQCDEWQLAKNTSCQCRQCPSSFITNIRKNSNLKKKHRCANR